MCMWDGWIVICWCSSGSYQVGMWLDVGMSRSSIIWYLLKPDRIMFSVTDDNYWKILIRLLRCYPDLQVNENLFLFNSDKLEKITFLEMFNKLNMIRYKIGEIWPYVLCSNQGTIVFLHLSSTESPCSTKIIGTCI